MTVTTISAKKKSNTDVLFARSLITERGRALAKRVRRIEGLSVDEALAVAAELGISEGRKTEER